MTAVKAPAGMDSGVIVKEFRNRFGAIIANGQGSMKGQIFRIAHLGYFDFADLFAVVAGLEIILNANGIPRELWHRRRRRAGNLCRSGAVKSSKRPWRKRRNDRATALTASTP